MMLFYLNPSGGETRIFLDGNVNTMAIDILTSYVANRAAIIYIYILYHICRGNGPFPSTRKYFNNHLIFQCWEVQIYFIFPKINSVWQRLRIKWDFAITKTAKRSSVFRFRFPIIFLYYSLLVPGIQDFYVQFLAGLLSHSRSLLGTELINIMDHTGYGLRTWIEITMTGTNHKSVI